MLLRGMRIDSITCVFGLYVIYFLSKNKHPIFEKRHIVLAFLLIVSLEVWAVLRSGLVNNEFNVMTSLEHILKGISASNAHDAKTYHGGTISPISNTMTNIIYLIDMDKMDYYYGKTILEFLPRTPPAFIYPDRPKDYAWIFTEYNMIAGGGFYELAEAYMNFGLLGAFIFPLLLTFFISASYWRVFYSQSIFNYFIFFSFLASWFRGNWYQIFAFYKNFVTAMILYFVFIIIFELLTSYNKKQIE